MSYTNDPNMYSPPPQQPYPGQPGYGAGYGAGYGTGYGAGGYAPALPPEIAPLPGASMGEAVRRFFQRYAQFRGCASLSEFWWAYLALTLVQLVMVLILFVVIAVIGGAAASGGSSSEETAGVIGLVMLIASTLLGAVSLGLLVPTIAVAVRRLHDAGYSGLLYLLNLVPGGSIAVIVLLCMPSKPERFRPEWG